MDRQQQEPRRRKASTSGRKENLAPERRREASRHSGDMPASGRRVPKDGAPKTSPSNGSGRRAYEERQHRHKQRLRREKQQRKIEKAEKRKQEAQRRPVRPFSRRTFLIRFSATIAVVITVLIAMTIFFKVDHIAISGNHKYSAQEIADASGIDLGENLLLLRKSAVAGLIHSNLPYVGDIQVGIKFPDTVNIDIVEQPAVFAIADTNGSWWLFSHEGVIIKEADASELEDYVRIEGAVALAPSKNSELQISQQDDISGVTNAEGENLTDRNTAIMQIITEIAAYDRSGDVTLIDVSDLWSIEIWYGKAFQVLLSEASDLSYKTRYMIHAVQELEADGYRGGILDLSFREDGQAVFTTW